MGVVDILTHNDLDSALKNKQLQVAFQPCVSLAKLSAFGAEAFLRWQHPALGLLPANLFMPFARHQGRTREVAMFMLRETLRAVSEWRGAGLKWKAYVNIDGADLSDGMLADSIALLLCEFDVPAEALTLDIRESDFSERGAQFLPHITALRTMGVGIALDTQPGEAPLQDISQLPLTEMKVAGPAIIRFAEMAHSAGLGRIINRLAQARAAGLHTCAVRVESEATLWALQRVGFDAAQGAYISPPVPLAELVRWDHIWRQAAAQLATQKQRDTLIASTPAKSTREAHAAIEEQLADRIGEPGESFVVDAEEISEFEEMSVAEPINPVVPQAIDETDIPTHDDFTFDTVEAAGEVEVGFEAVADDIAEDELPPQDEKFTFDEPAVSDDTISHAAAPPPMPERPAPRRKITEAEPASSGPPPNFTIHRKAPPFVPGPAETKGSLLGAVARAAKARDAADKTAPLDAVLIERRLPGMAKSITMQVAETSREGLGLFGKRKTGRKP